MGNGNNVLIGIDPIIGISDSLTLPIGFREYLEDLDIVTLSHARNTLSGLHKYWYMDDNLCVVGDWNLAWDTFTRSLEIGGIRLN